MIPATGIRLRHASCSIRTHYFPWPLVFSVERAASSILIMSLFPSLQAYSNIGPSTRFIGMIADQGLVHVDGSSIVNLYSIVSASRRLNRSVMRRVPGFAFWYVAPAL